MCPTVGWQRLVPLAQRQIGHRRCEMADEGSVLRGRKGGEIMNRPKRGLVDGDLMHGIDVGGRMEAHRTRHVVRRQLSWGEWLISALWQRSGDGPHFERWPRMTTDVVARSDFCRREWL